MNVTFQEAENCEAKLGVELSTEEVEKEWKQVVNLFASQAKIPGFRPGKAPRSIIESRYAKQIQEELIDRLTRTALQGAIKDKDLKVLSVPDFSRRELGADRNFFLDATVVLEPDFQLPDYENITVTIPEPVVTDEIFEQSLDRLREPQASYPDVEGRGVEKGDFAVITYEVALDGKPLKEAVPAAPPILHGRANFWVQVDENSFLPAFTDQLIGMNVGGKKTLTVPIGADFPVEELQNKTLEFDVSLEGLHLREMPDWSDELAAAIAPGKTLAELRSMVRENLEQMAKDNFEKAKRSEVVRALTTQVTCPLPRNMLAQETTAILRDVIQENQSRGVSEDEIREQTENLVGMARESAEFRVRSRFILLRVADKEKLKVQDQEMLAYLVEMSNRYDIPPKKLVKDMEKRNAFPAVREDLLVRKAVDFLAGKAVVQTPQA